MGSFLSNCGQEQMKGTANGFINHSSPLAFERNTRGLRLVGNQKSIGCSS